VGDRPIPYRHWLRTPIDGADPSVSDTRAGCTAHNEQALHLPQMGRSQRLLSLLDDGKTPILLDPRRSIFVGRKAVCFLDETTEARDPDLVGLTLLEDLVRRVVHRLHAAAR
jgi:hypothetical protein